MMRIWLINSSEAVPTDSGNARLRRTGILARLLVEQGEDVLWWTSTFHHVLKKQRYSEDTSITFADRYRLRFLHCPPYYRNTSFRRIWNHRVLGAKLRVQMRREEAPDIILCSFPTLELSMEAVRYGQQLCVPVILDIRDMWPDIFLDLAPRWARAPARLALSPMFRMARRACQGASAISGHAPAFVDWGLALAGRPRTDYDRDFPFGYSVHTHTPEQISHAAQFWEKHGVCAKAGIPIICYFGIIGDQFNMGTVIEAARRLQGSRPVQFVLCGEGPRLANYRKMAADCPNVIFPGWINAPEIAALMRMSSFAVAPYVSRTDFELSIPNKSIEYLAGGLPLLLSLKRGILHDLIHKHDCGVSYEDDAGKLANSICALCDAPGRRQEMAKRASELFESRFNASKVYPEMADHLRAVATAYASSKVS